MIFVSTGGYKNNYPSKTVEFLYNNGIKNIELSGGLFEYDLLKKLIKLKGKINFQIHNYFPPPKVPFVLNLASIDTEIAKQTIKHIKTAINWSIELDRPIYSFHAGFLVDPKPKELGKKISKRKVNKRENGLSLFIERVCDLADYAKMEGAQLLIENNVLSKQNYEEFNCNPLLMVDPDECHFVMENTPKNVNMLLDVAHLKVSSKSLDFDRNKIFDFCNQWIKAYHFSDNDGKVDSNKKFDVEPWFKKYIKRNLDYYSIEIYNEPIDIIKKQKYILEKIINFV